MWEKINILVVCSNFFFQCSFDKGQFFDLFYRWRHIQRDRQGYLVERCVSLSFGYPVMDLELPMISVDLDDDYISNIDPLRSTECCMNLYVGEKYSHRFEEIYNRSIEIGIELAVRPDVMFLEKGKILNHQNGLVPILVRKVFE